MNKKRYIFPQTQAMETDLHSPLLIKSGDGEIEVAKDDEEYNDDVSTAETRGFQWQEY